MDLGVSGFAPCRQQQAMRAYSSSLKQLKETVLIGEFFFLFLRLVSQILFTLPSSIALVQLLVASMLSCRIRCAPEAQLYLLLGLFMLFALGFNLLQSQFGNGDMRSSPLYENFNNNYKTWGYSGEVIFRSVGLVVAWRSYQFSQVQGGWMEGREDLEVV